MECIKCLAILIECFNLVCKKKINPGHFLRSVATVSEHSQFKKKKTINRKQVYDYVMFIIYSI